MTYMSHMILLFLIGMRYPLQSCKRTITNLKGGYARSGGGLKHFFGVHQGSANVSTRLYVASEEHCLQSYVSVVRCRCPRIFPEDIAIYAC